ncbi:MULTISPECIES: hypothetical protein [unclassified Gordonia (in: high G+C Gram-positive bacteria)]|uniref:hypothetical protein n=1 Tax=unclassified Gordonia (in: high G+C Gram-positive bacteria) TaxID=2657482 RepID=UPI001FFF28AB|nr:MULTISPECIES: hypothetical protein [unclassified Gordonia (in: high G+C Gram-positive bacteria)]UQE73522.1 hypothetical protein MYK68_12240 [Gordonia sp. PP30]
MTRQPPGPSAADEFSFGRMVARSLGAAALVLLIAIPIVWWISTMTVTVALAVAIAAVVLMVVVLAVVARRELRGVQREIDELRARRDDPPAGTTPSREPKEK